MFRAHNGLDVSSHIKIADNKGFPWVKEFYEVIKNAVDDVFVKHAVVTKAIDVELKAFQLHAMLSGYIGNM